jgi:hypothetical protein
MEMAGKDSDHYFHRWQAKIVTTINIFFEKNVKNEKCSELPDLARQLLLCRQVRRKISSFSLLGG